MLQPQWTQSCILDGWFGDSGGVQRGLEALVQVKQAKSQYLNCRGIALHGGLYTRGSCTNSKWG